MSEFIEVNRIGNSCYKWDMRKTDYIPFTIADADYSTATPIIEALQERVSYPVFGYTFVDEEYKSILINWFKHHYKYYILKEWIIPTSGVVTSLHFAVESLTSINAKVIIQTPVYTPFYRIIKDNNRILIENKLTNINECYKIDFNDLEEKLKDSEMLILCNPHNPVGRVYTYNEIKMIVEMCKKYNVIIVSDEIHCDLMINNNEFTSVGRFLDFYDKMVICTAPSKTFNIPGLQNANIIIKNNDIRYILRKLFNSRSVGPNLLGITACKAAYFECEEWLKSQLIHLTNNYQYLKDFFTLNIKQAKVSKLEGTYLVWINLKFLNFTSMELVKKLQEYGIGVNPGTDYGNDYDGYIRINIACSKNQLNKGLNVLKKFIDEEVNIGESNEKLH